MWFALLTLIHWITIYPVDSVIQPSNNWDLNGAMVYHDELTIPEKFHPRPQGLLENRRGEGPGDEIVGNFYPHMRTAHAHRSVKINYDVGRIERFQRYGGHFEFYCFK